MQSYLTLADVADRAATVAVACNVCQRQGQYRVAALVRAHGRDKSIPDWLQEVSADCQRRIDPGPSITDLCGVHCPTLSEIFLPGRPATDPARPFSPSEVVDIEDALLPVEAAMAKARQVASGGKGIASEKFSEAKGRAADHVAKIVGKDRTTIAKARAVRDAAKASPERLGRPISGSKLGPHSDGWRG